MRVADNSFALLLLGMALAGCNEAPRDGSTNNAASVALPADESVEPLPPGEQADDPNLVNGLNEADDAGSELPSPPNTPEQRMIPDQYRGRWAMVAADCDRNRSNPNGAITIGEKSIIFYESTATLKERRPAIATSFSGLFGFIGEGQTWQKVMTFTRTGNTLKRADKDGNTTYIRC